LGVPEGIFPGRPTRGRGGAPGAVIAIQTFGDFLGFHPHLHLLCSDGCFYGDGAFKVSPAFDTKPLEEIFRHKIFKMLLSKGKIIQEMVDLLMSWKNSGFNVFCGYPPSWSPRVPRRSNGRIGRGLSKRYMKITSIVTWSMLKRDDFKFRNDKMGVSGGLCLNHVNFLLLTRYELNAPHEQHRQSIFLCLCPFILFRRQEPIHYMRYFISSLIQA